MAYKSFLSDFYENRPLPGVSESRGSQRTGTERRDFNLKSAEAQRLFVWGMPPEPNGVVVTDDTLLSSTPFFGAMRYVSEGIMLLGRKVRRREGTRYVDDFEHPNSYLLRRRPNAYMTWADLIQAWVVNAMLGNGYLRIYWDAFTGRPRSVEHIPSRFVFPEFDTRGFLWYRISGEVNGVQVTTVLPHTDILHLKGLSLDGLLGRKTSTIHRSAHASALSADTYTESVFGKAAFPSIAVKTTEALDATEVALMEQNLMDRIGGAKRAGRPLVLDEGKDVQYLQWSPVDVALEQVKHLSVEQVSQLTKVPRELLGLDNRGTLGAAIQKSKDFFVHTLQPWSEKIEEELNTKLFTEPEVALAQYRFEFDTSLYLSMSEKEKVEMFAIAIKSAQMTPNEAREQMGKDAADGGDKLYGDINFVPLESVAQIALAKYLSSAGEKVLQSENQLSFNTDRLTDSEEPTTDNEQQTQPSKP